MRRILRIPATVAVLIVVGITLAGSTYEPETTIPPGFAGSHVQIHGVPIRVVQEGQGPDVLLIHGSPGSLEDFEPIRTELSRTARVTSFDRPNYGFSGQTEEYSLAHNADIALALIAALKLENVTVAGHSYGGSTALAMAIRKPPRVKAYVILDSAAYQSSREPTLLYRILVIPSFGTGFARLVGARMAAPRIAEGIKETFLYDEPSQEFIDLRIRLWSTPKATRAIAAETMGSPRYLATLNPHYGRITQPVRIVAQAGDAFRRETAERLHRDIPRSSLRLVEKSGHYVQFEQPEAVLEEIRAAIAEQ